MHASLSLLVSATAVVSATAIIAPRAVSSLGLGQPCSSSAQCANGAACYAVNSMQIPSCGNFQAACTADSQCAFNTCVKGFCNGLPSASSIMTSTTSTAPAPTGTGTVALGQPCSPSLPDQCIGGATCFAVNSMVIPLCGNFQAPCTSNAQCAFDTCIKGVCKGFPSSPATVPATSATALTGQPSAATSSEVSAMAASTQQPPAKASSGTARAPLRTAGVPLGIGSTRAPAATIQPVGIMASSAHMQNATMTMSTATGGAAESSGPTGPQHRPQLTTHSTKHAATPTPSPTKKKSSARRNGTEIGALLAVAAFVVMVM
ncbi:uncharacterized protein BP5553_08349 [Venustampulla echinocandica]|uniref:Extracellular membrane protein CFEM domain-containing protein n=1 Tax=Venustampulla echinocandica TaxID=2656787 RepID=A0A370TGG9_9HELO|nr:uncharacterized protein BP5553_08349 [Venustampulla echinocandica]RDL33981.1 hypothetical protein BP5553_08349 [Venustampulla echinocandica]